MLRKVFFRLTAVILGLTCTALVLEVVLQAAAAVLKRADQNDVREAAADEIRIACVGESTTYGKWPAQLEDLLNQGRSRRTVRVINRGVVGILTNGIADRIDGWLDEDRPHLVITMLGINDEGNVLVYKRGGGRPWTIEHFRTARLIDLLWRSRFDVGAPDEPEGEAPFAEAHLDPEVRSVLEGLEKRRHEATRRFRYSEMMEIHHELIATDPGTPVYHLAYLRRLVLHHDPPERLDEFFVNEVGVEPSGLDDEERRREIGSWAEQNGDRFTALRLAASVARVAEDTELERRLIERATTDPEIAGLAWLRWAAFATRWESPEMIGQCLRRADDALPEGYQWSLLLGDISFLVDEHALAAEHFEQALLRRPDLPASHELVLLGWIASSFAQAGDEAKAAAYRARRDELELGRFREFTRHNYQRVVDAVRDRQIPVIAMQYPRLSVEGLRKLLDYRDDVTYLENRKNFESALLEVSYRELFTDSFAGSFGHLTDLGNSLVAENVASSLAARMPELAVRSDETAEPPTGE